jgi:hypothetical protein
MLPLVAGSWQGPVELRRPLPGTMFSVPRSEQVQGAAQCEDLPEWVSGSSSALDQSASTPSRSVSNQLKTFAKERLTCPLSLRQGRRIAFGESLHTLASKNVVPGAQLFVKMFLWSIGIDRS